MFDKQTNIVNTLKLKKDIQFRDSENVITQKKNKEIKRKMAQTKVVYYVGDENTPYLVKVRL